MNWAPNDPGLGVIATSLISTGTPGHPITGAWATNQVIIDSNGIVWRCTAGGTPGTWIEGASDEGSNSSIIYVGPPTGNPAIDTPAIAVALNTANTAGAGRIILQAAPQAAPYVVSLADVPAGYGWTAPVTIGSFVAMEGASDGGTWIQLAPGSNCDLFQTLGFATYTGVTTPAADLPQRFEVKNLVFSHNGANQTAGRTASICGCAYNFDQVEFRDSWGWGLWSEYPSTQPGTYPDQEAVETRWDGVRVTNYYCNPASADSNNSLYGVYWIGPHDSVWVNVHIWSFHTAPTSPTPPTRPYQYGLGIDSSTTSVSSGAGLQITNLHLYGRNDYGIDPRGASGGQGGVYFANCESESAFIANVIMRSNCTWVGGTSYSTTEPSGANGFQIGPSSWNAYPSNGCAGSQIIGPVMNHPDGYAFNFVQSFGSNIIIANQHQGVAPVTGSPATSDVLHIIRAFGGNPTNGPAGSTNSFSQDLSLAMSFRFNPTAVLTASYAAAALDLAKFDTTAGAIAQNLPNAPLDKSLYMAKIVAGANQLTLNCQGSDVINIAGGPTSYTLKLLNQAVLLQYQATGAVWSVLGDDLPLGQLDARYAPIANALAPTLVTATNAALAVPAGAGHAIIEVIGGGGGGGGGGASALTGGTATQVGGGGGGSGEYTKRYVALAGIASLAVTIGAGGAGGTGGAASTGISGNAGSGQVGGSNTTVTATGISITAQGGAPGLSGGANSASTVGGGNYAARLITGTNTATSEPGCGGQATSSQGFPNGGAIGFSGRPGAGGAPASSTLGGVAGIAYNVSNGHTGTTAGASASTATDYGQGGDGGGGGAPGGAGGNGAAGNQGCVLITWLA